MFSLLIEFPLDFWRRHPALLFGLFSLLGTVCAIAWHPIYLCAMISLLFPLFFKKNQRTTLICALLFFTIMFGYTSFRNAPIDFSGITFEGEGVFHIENLSIIHSPFNRCYHYRGTLQKFQTNNGIVYRNLPCSVFYPLKNAPTADKDYVIQGSLSQKKSHFFCLKPKKAKKWTSIENTFSLAAWRYDAKNAVCSYIKKHISNPSSSTFLSALITGNIDERTMRLDFSRLGLQHILAISGFHFSFFALALNILFRPFLPFKMRIIALILSLAAYFFFLGNAPSILRAFVAICIFLGAQLLKRRTSGLNALGAALIIELLISPLSITHLSFQLSFLCTLALLLFSDTIHHICSFLFPQRCLQQLHEMRRLDQHGYILSSLLRKCLSLNFAVHLFSLPILLYLFHKFPLLSLLYNLFFPLCVSLSLTLLCCAFLTAPLLPFLSAFFHHLNDKWTSCLLQLTSNPPAYFDVILRCNTISFPLAIFSLLLLFHLGMLSWTWQRLKRVSTKY